MEKCLRTIYEILDAFRVRPALFVGNIVLQDPFPILLGFIEGLSFSDRDSGSPSFWEFRRWLTGRFDNLVAMPFEWLHEELGSKAAYAAFFSYLDEYRACSDMEVMSAVFAELTPLFYILDNEGNRQKPPVPDKLFVGRFSPSEVYYLGEMYGSKMERCTPFLGTEKAVRAEATSKWGVPMSAWSSRTSRST